jgi:hypothetical protein
MGSEIWLKKISSYYTDQEDEDSEFFDSYLLPRNEAEKILEALKISEKLVGDEYGGIYLNEINTAIAIMTRKR